MLRVNTKTMEKVLYPAVMANDRIDKLEAVLKAARNFVFELEEFLPGCTKELCPGLVYALMVYEVGE
jgi:hypothetical protein